MPTAAKAKPTSRNRNATASAQPDSSHLDQPELDLMDAYWRAANYLSVGQIYLNDNPLLRRPLTLEHIKPRLLGHWGTTPGLNFIYRPPQSHHPAQHDLNMIYIVGPGHGGPGIVANTYLEGTYTEIYPNIERNTTASSASSASSHSPAASPATSPPETPGSIHEGGELGYSLLHAYGAAFDNPDLIVACIVGDGEAETGAARRHLALQQIPQPRRATAPSSPSFISTATRSPTPPSSPASRAKNSTHSSTATATSRYFVEGDDPAAMHQQMAATLDTSLSPKSAPSRSDARETQRRHAPALAHDRPAHAQRLDWPQGCGRQAGRRHLARPPSAARRRSRQARAPAMLEEWMRSYQPEELFDENGTLHSGIARNSRPRANAAWAPTRMPTAACCCKRSAACPTSATTPLRS